MIPARRGGRGRRRRDGSRRALKWLFALAVVALSSFYGYRTGTRLAEIELDRLRGELATLAAGTAALAEREASHRQALDTALAQADEARSAYARDVPTGERKRLYNAMVGRLREGVSAERLGSVIAAAGETRDCDAALAPKRFIVTTPLQRAGRNTAVSFHGGTIIVTANGASATDARGNAEAWFDPAQPVTASAVALSGGTEDRTGPLPLQLSLVIGDTEHRLSIRAGPTRGFVQATLQTCRFP